MRWSRPWVVNGRRLSGSDQAASRGEARAESESTASREESRAGTRMTFLGSKVQVGVTYRVSGEAMGVPERKREPRRPGTGTCARWTVGVGRA